MLDRLEAMFEGLAEFPLSGGLPKERADLGILEYRGVSVTPYRVSDDNGYVLMIADGRRTCRRCWSGAYYRRDFGTGANRAVIWCPHDCNRVGLSDACVGGLPTRLRSGPGGEDGGRLASRSDPVTAVGAHPSDELRQLSVIAG